MKLGKRPATKDSRDLCFATYRTAAPLPVHPTRFGHETGIKNWGMFGNDTVGDCAFAGPAHETMLWTREAGKAALFTTASVLSDYSAVTGYDPSDPSTDVGADVRDVLKYRVKTGLIDATGKRHKIGAYVKLDTGNWSQMLEALYLFGTVGIGWQFPDSAMDQFNRGEIWSVVDGANVSGGHYTPLVAERAHGEVVTWGRIQGFTTNFLRDYCDEAWTMLSPEMLTAGKSIEGFSLAQLQADLARL